MCRATCPSQAHPYTQGQKRRVTEQTKRELKRRSTVEPVIGHLKAEHRMGRNDLAYSHGDAIIAAAGHNFSRLLAWLALLCAHILAALLGPLPDKPQYRLA